MGFRRTLHGCQSSDVRLSSAFGGVRPLLISFPIIRRFEIKGYQLFQTETSDGLTHKLDRGVHAFVGINGLGKTTVLTLLYRLLLGPFQPKTEEATSAGLLGSQRETESMAE